MVYGSGSVVGDDDGSGNSDMGGSVGSSD